MQTKLPYTLAVRANVARPIIHKSISQCYVSETAIHIRHSSKSSASDESKSPVMFVTSLHTHSDIINDFVNYFIVQMRLIKLLHLYHLKPIFDIRVIKDYFFSETY